jgi:hypothetical protein
VKLLLPLPFLFAAALFLCHIHLFGGMSVAPATVRRRGKPLADPIKNQQALTDEIRRDAGI